MAHVFDLQVDRKMSLDEYVAFVEEHVDVQDEASIAEGAWALRALANDRDFILNGYHESLKTYWNELGAQVDTPQSYMNARRTKFYIRTNIWLPLAKDSQDTRYERRLYAYDLPHDHNFDFLTVGYFGPGYETDLYEYDYDKIFGYEGERVAMTDLGRRQLTPGRMMLYRRGKDIHTQLPPDRLSISLNLMCVPRRDQPTQQYVFDVHNKVLLKGAGDRSSIRLFMLELLRELHNDDTLDILESYVKGHVCKRTRAYALKVLSEAKPQEAERFRSLASNEVIELSTLPLAHGHGVREIVA